MVTVVGKTAEGLGVYRGLSTDLPITPAPKNGSRFFAMDNGKTYWYDADSETWEGYAGGGGASALDDLSDVAISTATDGQELTYDSSSSKWVNTNKPTLTNPNLLDNPWFTVNQRSATTISSAGYGADRWYFISGTSAAYSSNGVEVNNSQICEIFENQLLNKTYTASLLLSDGTIISGTQTKADDTTTLTFISNSTYSVDVKYNPTNKRFIIDTETLGGDVDIRAVKLEVGSLPTLAYDVAPDYTTELLKCQRYFSRINLPNVNQQIYYCWNYSANTATGSPIALPVPMRAVPAMSYVGTFKLKDSGVDLDVTNLAISSTSSNSIIRIDVTTSGATANGFSILLTSSGSAYIDLNAEL